MATMRAPATALEIVQVEKLLQLLNSARQQCPAPSLAWPGSTIESVVKNKAAGFNAGSNAMYEPVKRDSCVLYNTGDIANIGVVAYNNTRVVSNTGTTLHTVERDSEVSYNNGVVAYNNTGVVSNTEVWQ